LSRRSGAAAPQKAGCPFVPRLLESDPAQLKIITTNCGTRVDQVNPERQKELFAELEKYGVRHEDRELRNITYRTSDGRFCIIDFEFATILGGGQMPSRSSPRPPNEHPRKKRAPPARRGPPTSAGRA
jgi:hypothetical protein